MLEVFAEEGPHCPGTGSWEDLSAGQRGREHLGLPTTALLPSALLQRCWWSPGQGAGAGWSTRGRRGEHQLCAGTPEWEGQRYPPS